MKKPSFFENGFRFTSFWRKQLVLLYFGHFTVILLFLSHRSMKRLVQIPLKSCSYPIVPEQKARTTYDNLLRLIDDPDVREPLKFLREREVVHFQRFGDALRVVQDNLDAKNYYAYNPSIDIRPKEK